MTLRPLLYLALAVFAGCASAPPEPEWSGPAPERLVAEIRATGAFAVGELDVQPLRDPMVEDLRGQAVRFESAQRYADAAAALDKALSISPDDPALLQERAEAAVLLKDLAGAEALARRAYDIGARVGPLCRRHWATIRQSLARRQRLLDARANGTLRGEKLAQWERERAAMMNAIAESADAQEACTLTGPPRY
jgi:tetratricopeptide (TPR) repeat protein